MNEIYTLAWDIGGAHVKAAATDPAGNIIAVLQEPCPLWQGLAQLREAVNRIIRQLPAAQYCHVMTMTGELADLFADRDDGVRQIIATMSGLLAGQQQMVFAGKLGIFDIRQITPSHYQDIASSNWLASASYCAQQLADGLLVDVGSTTTDILLFKDGNVQVQGYTDYQRLQSQELVYTGIIRTAVMAVAQTAEDAGQEIGIMAEYFATMADVYRLTGELNEAHDQSATADGAEKTVAASARRLARMIGCDYYPEELPRWQRFARAIRQQQLQKIQRSCMRFLATANGDRQLPLVGAGVGRFLVQAIAENLGHPYLDFSGLCTGQLAAPSLALADCAPAVALAKLAWADAYGKAYYIGGGKM